ncbi:MAG: N-acetyl-gamma-glutamyl-phosphate reductase [Planctomycetota bacterium]
MSGSKPHNRRAAIVGATGFAGRELRQLLARHPSLSCTIAMSSRTPDAHATGSPLAAAESPAPGHDIEPLDTSRFGEVDGVFLCTPHGKASAVAKAAVAAGARVVDLSADFRLGTCDRYETTYGTPHPEPDLLAEAVYGLTEHARSQVSQARLVANPGCYPTSILLPLLPLLAQGLVASDSPIIADSKSGVSGAGKSPSDTTHYANVHENCRAYGIGSHRHAPEIELHAGAAATDSAGNSRIVFTPHLLPAFRGILTTMYVQPATADVTAATMRSCLHERYADEAFVRVLPAATHKTDSPQLRCVQGSNRCHIAVHDSGPLIVLTSAIDNLVKGAAGQAVQNMNCMLGLPESEGLT